MINKDTYKTVIKEVLQKQDNYAPNYSNDNILNYLNKNVLNERDFYPPPDDRIWESYIEDIEDGDTFVDYCKEFFILCDEEELFD